MGCRGGRTGRGAWEGVVGGLKGVGWEGGGGGGRGGRRGGGAWEGVEFRVGSEFAVWSGWTRGCGSQAQEGAGLEMQPQDT